MYQTYSKTIINLLVSVGSSQPSDFSCFRLTPLPFIFPFQPGHLCLRLWPASTPAAWKTSESCGRCIWWRGSPARAGRQIGSGHLSKNVIKPQLQLLACVYIYIYIHMYTYIVFWRCSFLVGVQKTELFATIPRLERQGIHNWYRFFLVSFGFHLVCFCFFCVSVGFSNCRCVVVFGLHPSPRLGPFQDDPESHFPRIRKSETVPSEPQGSTEKLIKRSGKHGVTIRVTPRTRLSPGRSYPSFWGQY